MRDTAIPYRASPPLSRAFLERKQSNRRPQGQPTSSSLDVAEAPPACARELQKARARPSCCLAAVESAVLQIGGRKSMCC
jgi:hypothetical protein